ncbi:MAG: replicative DNA helicase [Acidobacteria bacterium]|uniref:Replicative DNA helicase n=1 Tax=Candidatus Polarisedimenticola svalbardensis TaxID=2886004 RepID=A0A8J7CJR4_9BACT|nr:replicative DNA helicase [Candidatus Polarisedimenticola svalbardensis]
MSARDSLPHSEEAERSVLGSVLVDNNQINKAQEILSWEAFYSARHRKIFQAIERLSQNGTPMDLVTLRDELDRAGDLESCGGPAYISDLLDGFSRSMNVEHYAKIVKEKATLRELIQVSQWVGQSALDGEGTTDEILDEAEKKIFQVSQGRLRTGFVHIRESGDKAIKRLEELTEQQEMITGVATGIMELDNMTSGFQNTDLLILAARPSMGKTAFALNIAAHAALRADKTVGIFSLEMSHEQLFTRMLCAEARIDAHRLRTGRVNNDDWAKIIKTYQTLAETKVYIDDTAGVNIVELRAKSRRLAQEHGLDLLIIDYLQLMGGGARYSSRQQEISDISRSLKGLAKELHVPILALSQLSRAPDQRSGDHRPQLSDLRESGAIEQDADVVMFLFREEVYDKEDPDLKGKAELIVGKQRNGAIGKIDLVFIKEHTRFENMEWREG